MTFGEFDNKCEIRLGEAVTEIIMQPRKCLTISEKQYEIAKTIQAYVRQYEEITGNKADIYAVLKVMM